MDLVPPSGDNADVHIFFNIVVHQFYQKKLYKMDVWTTTIATVAAGVQNTPHVHSQSLL